MRKKLEQAIKEKGYNANSLAIALGINRSNIYNHIKGVSSLGSGKARKIAEFLKISLDDIYAE